MTHVRVVDGESIEYLLRTSSPCLAVVFHGGHMRAELETGQDFFIEAGCAVLQPSRPSHGKTPRSAPDQETRPSLIESLWTPDGLAGSPIVKQLRIAINEAPQGVSDVRIKQGPLKVLPIACMLTPDVSEQQGYRLGVD